MNATKMTALVAAMLLAGGCDGGDRAVVAGGEGVDPPPLLADHTATPSARGEDGQLVTDAPDVVDTLGVFSAGGGEPYVVDSNRRAVYLLEGDTDGSGCLDACLGQWAPVGPPVGAVTTDGALAPVLVDVIRRPDGTGQLTYDNHPLYHYAGDQAVGDTTGHQVRDQWGSWYLLTPQGDAVGEKRGAMPDEPGGRADPVR